jgi:hypothetical protein
MKKLLTILAIIFALLLTSCVNAQSTSIADKNNPQSILFVFQRFVDFPTDTIVDFLARNGEYTEIFLNDERVAGKPSDYYGYEGEEDDEIYRISYYLDTAKNAIRKEDSYIKGNSSFCAKEYKLLNSKHNTKFMFSTYCGTRALTTPYDIEIYDYDFQADSFSFDSISSELFSVFGNDFLLPTPDSLEIDYFILFHTFYIENSIAICLFDTCPRLFEILKENKWLKGNVIRFDFIDGEFIRSEPYFEYD